MTVQRLHGKTVHWVVVTFSTLVTVFGVALALSIGMHSIALANAKHTPATFPEYPISGRETYLSSGTVASILITPNLTVIPVSTTQLFTATAYDDAGNPLAVSVTWLPPSGGSIVSSGAYTMVYRSGTAVGYYANAVQAESNSIIGTATVRVTSGPLYRIYMVPSSFSVLVSKTYALVAIGYDFWNNVVPLSQTSWTVNSLAGSIVISTTSSAVFGASTLAQYFSQAITITQGSIFGTASVNILPDAPSLISMVAIPDLLRTDGVSTSTIAISVTDRYGNLVGPGTPVSVSTDCPGTCTLSIDSGFTDSSGSFTTLLTSTMTSITQDITSEIHVTAMVATALSSSGYITHELVVLGEFIPAHAYIPMLIDNRYQNHSGCSALNITPPVTISQSTAYDWNIYKFTATTARYNFYITNYMVDGELRLYQIEDDECAISNTIYLGLITSTAITSSTMFSWSPDVALVPDASYMLGVYNVTHSDSFYTVSVFPYANLVSFWNGALLQGGQKANIPVTPSIVADNLEVASSKRRRL